MLEVGDGLPEGPKGAPLLQVPSDPPKVVAGAGKAVDAADDEGNGRAGSIAASRVATHRSESSK
jgi:hypothetical protein